MRRQRQRREAPIPEPVDEEVEEENVDEKNGFFACYLLCSLCPRYKGHTYIGFTINPRRRIRQHNGEIRCGAWRTKCKRPWEMILCIYGFPSKVSALQFEWAWQHPKESLAVRKAAATFRSLSGIENKIKLAYTMLTLPQWERLNLTVNFFSTKYTRHSARCPRLPKHMRMCVRPIDELPCYMGSVVSEDDDDNDGDEDELPCYVGIDITDDNEIDVSTSTGASMNYALENRCQRRGELCDSLYGERESSDFTLQKEQMITHCALEPLETPMDEKNGTIPSRTHRCTRSSHGGDLCRQADELERLVVVHHLVPSCLTVSPVHSDKCELKRLVGPLEASCLAVSPIHSNKYNILFPCIEEPFDCLNSGRAQVKQLTPRTVNYGASCNSAPPSPGCNIIDLSTPSSCIARSGKRQSSFHVEVIDLIDSPI